MEGHCSTDQSPQWTVVPMEEEEECKWKPSESNLKYYLTIILEGLTDWQKVQ